MVQRVYVPYCNDVIVCKLIIVMCIVVALYCKQLLCARVHDKGREESIECYVSRV